jgi:hypothetical protein
MLSATYDNFGLYDSFIWYDVGLDSVPIISTMSRDIFINQGQDFSKVFRMMHPKEMVPVDITGATFIGAMQQSVESTLTIPFTFDILDGPGGKFTMSLTHLETQPLEHLTYIYTVQMTLGGVETRPFEGTAFISLGVV